MRLFYKYTDEKHIEVVTGADGKSEVQTKTLVADVEALVDSGESTLYDILGELQTAVKYQENRRRAYPDMQEQLDKMYHDGFDAWKETIQAVKDKHPKP